MLVSLFQLSLTYLAAAALATALCVYAWRLPCCSRVRAERLASVHKWSGLHGATAAVRSRCWVVERRSRSAQETQARSVAPCLMPPLLCAKCGRTQKGLLCVLGVRGGAVPCGMGLRMACVSVGGARLHHRMRCTANMI
jgi:hypothetical protein